MKKIALFTFLATQLLVGDCYAAKSSPLLSQAKSGHIFINNRILAKVNGKPISVIDVMKKMDMLFYRQYPQYAAFPEARFQFYQINWKFVLKELVEKELILGDAEENKITVSNGDIRQEMETLFGPNIISNLDKAGLTYEEAWNMVKEELTIRKTIVVRVNAKAVRSVTPSDIRAAYEEFAKENTLPEAWRYQVVSIRGNDSAKGAEAANRAYEALTSGVSLDALPAELKATALLDDSMTLNVSEEYLHNEKEISEANKNILSSLETNCYSAPIVQQSKAKNGTVFRIFCLKEHVAGGAPPFSEVVSKLKGKLTEKAIETESEKYIAKLRQHFDAVDGEHSSLYPEGFQPFALH